MWSLKHVGSNWGNCGDGGGYWMRIQCSSVAQSGFSGAEKVALR